MTHSQKLKLARRMITLQEIRDKVPLFSSRAWTLRKDNIQERVMASYKKANLVGLFSPSWKSH